MKKNHRSAARRAEEAVKKAVAVIEDAGWVITRRRADGEGLFVAQKRVFEREDDSVTTLFESTFTLEGLAKQVTRREREEGFSR